MLQGYFGVRGLVDVPPFASKKITSLDVSYSWSGLGDPVKFSYVVSRTSAGKFAVKGQSGQDKVTPISDTVDETLIAGLPDALTELIPMATQANWLPCWDD